MEESKNVLLGIYVMGIPRRPELANKPCVISLLAAERKIVLAVTYDDKVENISFDLASIVGAKNMV